MKSPTIQTYTAISRGYDELKPITGNHHTKFKAYAHRIAQGWECVPFDTTHNDPCRAAKRYKIMAHEFIDADVSVWIDGNMHPKSNYDARRLIPIINRHPVATLVHPTRKCIYHEAIQVCSTHLDDPSRVFNQIHEYQRQGYPFNHGLWWCCLIVRNHRHPDAKRLNQAWWEEITKGSRRDQISFPVVCHRLGIKPVPIPHEIKDMFEWTRHRGTRSTPGV